MPVAAFIFVGRSIGLTIALLVFGFAGLLGGGSIVEPSTAYAACSGEFCGGSMSPGRVERPRRHREGGRREGGRRERGSRIPGIGGGIMITIPTHVPEFESEPQVERPPRAERPRVVDCGPGEVFSRKRGACVPRKERPSKVAECGPGQFYSKARNACACRKGFVPGSHGCIKPVRVAECGKGEVYSKSRESCVCRKGFVRFESECGRPPVVVVKPPKRQPPVIVVAPPKRQPPVIVVAPPKRQPPVVVVKEPALQPVAVQEPEPVTEPQAEPAAAPAKVRKAQTLATLPDRRECLPPDLYDMLKEAYGRTPEIDRCEAACLAKPANFSEDRLADMTRRFGVEWCNECIKLGGWLPLSDIQRLEQLTGATFCMTGGASFCSAPGYARVDPLVTKVKVIETIRELPATLGKEGDIAVVIGNETYANGIPAKPTASGDADAVMTLLNDKLRYQPQNVIDLRNATLDDLRRVFGGPDGIPGELAKLYGGREKGDIFVYISSHGMRDEASGKSYLLPIDAKDTELAATAYALDDLYANLGKVGARTIMLALETSFGTSLASIIDPPNLPEAEASVLPETPVPGLAVFTASDRDQRPLDDPEFGLGLFTRYLIEGMAGKADAAPTGNDDKRLDSVELYVYTANMVRIAARKSLGLEQKPQLSKVDNLLIGRLAGR